MLFFPKFKTSKLHQEYFLVPHRLMELMSAFVLWSIEKEYPNPVVTCVSRGPRWYKRAGLKDRKFSWHFVNCAVDVRTFHYTPEQLGKVLRFFELACAEDEWELYAKQHGTGPHIHVAWRDTTRRKMWYRNKGKGRA